MDPSEEEGFEEQEEESDHLIASLDSLLLSRAWAYIRSHLIGLSDAAYREWAAADPRDAAKMSELQTRARTLAELERLPQLLLDEARGQKERRSKMTRRRDRR